MAYRTLHQAIEGTSRWKDSEYRESYIRTLKAITPNTPISKIDTDWTHKIARCDNGATHNRRMNLLASILSDEGVDIKLPRMVEPESARRSLTDEEMTAVTLWYDRNASEGQKALFIFHRDTGARPGAEARCFELDFVRYQVVLRSKKGGKGVIERRVPMTAALREALYGMRDKRMPTSLAPSWNKMRAALFPGELIPPYTLRHTFAMRLLRGGIPIHVVSKLMGHKSLETTMQYTRNTPEDLLRAAAVLNNI